MTPAHGYFAFWIIGLILLSLNPSGVSIKDQGTVTVLLLFGCAGLVALVLGRNRA